jgi:Cu+-exporting ATPase
VASATVNLNGAFTFRATKVGQDTTLARIVAIVAEASASKAPISRLADRISAVFVPVVMIIALVTGLVWLIAGASFTFALSAAIAVLVISCPCALGLATPVAIMTGTGAGASHGILVRSGEALEIAQQVDTVVLDKTGTITEGKPGVTDVLPLSDLGEDRLLALAASLEKRSEHPLSRAVVAEAESRGLEVLESTDFSTTPGRGVSARIGGELFFAGNWAYLTEQAGLTGDLRLRPASWPTRADPDLPGPKPGCPGPHRHGRHHQADQPGGNRPLQTGRPHCFDADRRQPADG